ncbi:MAG: hypothetical protein H6741_05775 [Alphaproteobacteria bacterium]|nr:hypothetical protein [Alphaproteobacteria bacterium]MCB9792216.1 hypothetical protein [Alphaproteobacteria bacterium]
MTPLLALLFACTGEEPAQAPLPAKTTVAEAPKPLRLPPGARVVTDISGSMQGFVGGGGNHLIQLHEELTGALGAQGVPGALEYCLVSTDVSCDGKTNLGRYGDAKLYTGKESRFDKALDLKGDEGPDSRYVTVILTDGVYGGGGGNATDMAGCAAGATVACIGQRLVKLAEAGYGVWVVGASLPFDGRVYAERSMDQGQFDRLKAGLGDHQRVEAFKAHATDASYGYTGPRPLLTLVVTKDVTLGRKLAAELERRFKAVGVASPDGDGVHSAEWAPLDTLTEKLTPAITSARVDRVRTEGFQLGKQSATTGGYAMLVRCGATDNGALRIDGRNITSSTRLSAGAGNPDGVAPRLKIDGNAVSLGLVCADLPAGSTTDLRFTLSAEPEAMAYLDPWVRTWHAEDTWSKPEGLFGLGSLAELTTRVALEALPLEHGLFVRVERE